ncbi:TauD/TfdA dioxygenase family protein [Dankookia sp. P2]|uniref:TauD/TfdA dioxygenase family protein n=1 Tax=Dankookia sp. P2 TaxID=3423955 RepID=UPI003D666262
MDQPLCGLRGAVAGDAANAGRAEGRLSRRHFSSHDGKTRKEYYADKIGMKVIDPGSTQTVSTHPLIRTHPETGRRALFVGGHLHRFEEMTESREQAADRLPDAACDAAGITCRFRWASSSLAFWDNRCTMHFAINDYPAETRIMHRVTVCGDVPF